MPEIRAPKNNEAKKKAVSSSKVVSAYSEEGVERNARTQKSERTFKALAVIVLILIFLGIVVFFLLNGIYHFF